LKEEGEGEGPPSGTALFQEFSIQIFPARSAATCLGTATISSVSTFAHIIFPL